MSKLKTLFDRNNVILCLDEQARKSSYTDEAQSDVLLSKPPKQEAQQ